KQSDLRLLVGRQPERGRIVGDRSRDQTAVVAPTEGDVRLDLIDLVELILDLSRLLESLVVINAEDSFRQIGVEEESAALRREVARPRVPGGEEGREPFVIRQVDAHRYAVNLRQIPRDREGDRRVQNHAEVVRIARALPKVVGVNHDVFPDALLNADIELMAAAGFERLSGRVAQYAVGQSAPAG